MNLETLLVAAICLLVGFLVGYLAGNRRAEADRWTRSLPPSGNPVRTDTFPPTPVRAQGQTIAESLPPDVMSEVHRLIAQGNKISAIKRVRQATGMGLKESKELVESWMG